MEQLHRRRQPLVRVGGGRRARPACATLTASAGGAPPEVPVSETGDGEEEYGEVVESTADEEEQAERQM